jgi:acyl-coenzyme A thioesterase PaaI-like protein
MPESSGVAPIDDPTLGLGDADPGGFPHILTWDRPGVASPGGGPAYGELIGRLRTFLDHVAAAKPDQDTISELSDELLTWTTRLAPEAVSEREQLFAHRLDLPGRGQTMSPAFLVTSSDRESVTGTVRFGRYYLGGNGAVHGGAIPLLFDEVLGRLANSGGRAGSRTAYLHTDYRSITPVGRELSVRGWFVHEEGRKRLLHAELRDGETLCAEAEGLFVTLRPGQP